MTYFVLSITIVLLIAAAIYSTRVKHPETKPLAAYLIFVVSFSTVSFVIFAAAISFLRLVDYSHVLTHPVGALILLLTAAVPAFIVGRWQIRKTPKARRLPD
jgi:hypothetical protein